MHKWIALLGLSLLVLSTVGCASKAPPPTGFLSDYSKLEEHKDGAMRYISQDLKTYSSFMLDPVEMRARGSLKPNEAAEVANYFNDRLGGELAKRGFNVVSTPGAGVGRVRVALTDINESTWWMNLHPASKITGVGTGGASMEGEVVDSVTGRQLAAVIQAGKGNQFELDTFNRLDDVKDTINEWAENAGNRMAELRAANASR